MVSHRVNYLVPTNTSQCRYSVAQLTTEKAKFLNNNPAASAFNSVLKLPVAGTRLRWTGGLGNIGNVAYYWTRSIPDSQLYRYARYLYFGKHSTHPAFYNVERSEGKSIRCIKN
jgi:hypothetical protein